VWAACLKVAAVFSCPQSAYLGTVVGRPNDGHALRASLGGPFKLDKSLNNRFFYILFKKLVHNGSLKLNKSARRAL
jgi:hypothetical protein